MCDSGCCPPCPPGGIGCPPCPYPYAQVCMLTPPCCVVPTEPKYVKPLALPDDPPKKHDETIVDPNERFRLRISNFYNNYDVDYHCVQPLEMPQRKRRSLKKMCSGVTEDGCPPRCDDYCKPKDSDCDPPGCPTGFKPCSMKLCPPPGCDPLGVWKASIQPCPPKPRKAKNNKYIPGECKRPCCLHWKPKGGVCKYDKPCKAHCYDHPPGIKPSHQGEC